jgi:serine/threonine-protein kinase SRPK3
VFELMGETMRSFGAWFRESMVPYSIMRRFTIQLLAALDFAHEHNVIHTGELSVCQIRSVPEAF